MQKQFLISFGAKGMVEDLDLRRLMISPVFQHRLNSVEDKDIDDLANSIKQNGLLHPLIVRMKENRFEIVAGNRRYLACKKLGWRKVMCHIVEADDREAFEISLIENIHRKSLDPIEEAQAFKLYVVDYGWGGSSCLASKIGKSPGYVSKRLTLLNLPENILTHINNHEINPSVCEELIPIIENDYLEDVAKIIMQNNLTAKETRSLVKGIKTEICNKAEDKDLVKTIDVLYRDHIVDVDALAQHSFDKAIITLKIATSKLAKIIESVEDNWIVYEMLMQHKNMINNQIDILIKEKKKL